MPVNYPALVGATILPNVGGLIASYYSRNEVKTWYENLKKPKWRPPNWAFGPVWTGLYCGIGYGSYLVYRDGGGIHGSAALPLALYGTNLALNWAWMPIFFNFHRLDLAFYEINLVAATAAATGYLFYQINKTAGYLLIPYVLWLGVASALTYTIYRDNPGPTITEVKESKD